MTKRDYPELTSLAQYLKIGRVGSPGGSDGKESACNAGDPSSIPGLGRSSGEGKGYPLQYPGLENPMDCAVCGVAKSRTRLSGFPSLARCNPPEEEEPTLSCQLIQRSPRQDATTIHNSNVFPQTTAKKELFQQDKAY